MLHLPPQTFSWLDIPLLFILFFLELILSSDNAAILSFIIRDLPLKQRKKALFLGIISSFTFRAVGVLCASVLIRIFWVQIIGGLYLLFLGVKQITQFRVKKKNLHTERRSLLRAVIYIEIADAFFAIDAIFAAFALVAIYYPYNMIMHKLWVIYLGGIIGVIFVRHLTVSVVKLINRYPTLEKMIYLLIGWMGLKLIFEGGLNYFPDHPVHTFFDFFFWLGALLIIIIAFLSTKWDKKV